MSGHRPPSLPHRLVDDAQRPHDGIEAAWSSALAAVSADALPAPVRVATDRSIVDTIACIVAGRPLATTARLRAALGAGHGRAGEDPPALAATLSGLDADEDASRHALLLGLMAHVNDLDDVCWTMMGHPSSPVVSAAITAVGHASTIVDGAMLQGAVAAGLEATIDLGARLVPMIYERGWHATSVTGVVGAAVAAGKILGLDADGLHHAMGIAASSSSGLRVNFGSDVKSLHVGRAASLGVEAARFAAAGMTADRHWLTGRFGHLDVLVGTSWREDPALTEGAHPRPGTWLTVEPGILLKRHASCAATHPAADAALALRAGIGDVDAIERIHVVTPATAALPLLDRLPVSPLEAKFSMEYCLAHTLRRGSLGLDAFTDEAFADPATQSLLRKVAFDPDPSAPDAIPATDNRASAATVTIDHAGSASSARVEHPVGAPEHPLSAAQFADKIATCWRFGTSEPVAAGTLERLHGLTGADDVAAALGAITPPRSIS